MTKKRIQQYSEDLFDFLKDEINKRYFSNYYVNEKLIEEFFYWTDVKDEEEKRAVVENVQKAIENMSFTIKQEV